MSKQNPDVKTQIKTIAEGLGISEEISKTLAEKCYDEVSWRPYGGATSFADIDKAMEANEIAAKVNQTTYQLEAIVNNITSDEEMSVDEKTAAIKSAADEFKGRLSKLDDYEKTSLWDKVVNFVKGKPEMKREFDIVSFKAFEDKNGEMRWISFSSNAFEDLEKELFTTKALEEAVEHAEKTGERGPLLLYHVPAAEVGQCDFQAVQGRFLIESGTFSDTPLGRKALEYFTNSDEEHQVSIGYTYKAGDEQDGTYDWLRINERSVCPFGTAANPWTDFSLFGDKEMHEKQKEWMTKVFGEELAQGVIAKADSKTKELEDQNVRFKTTTEESAQSEAFIRQLAEKLGADPDKAVEEAKALATAEAAKETAAVAEAPAEATQTGLSGEQLQALASLINEMADRIDEIGEEVKSLKKATDEKVEEATLPRLQLVKAKAPTEDATNVIPDEAAKKIMEAVGSVEQDNNPVSAYVDMLRGRTAAGN